MSRFLLLLMFPALLSAQPAGSRSDGTAPRSAAHNGARCGGDSMYASFSSKADLSGFTAIPTMIDLTNTANSYGTAIAATMDFSKYGRVDEQMLNQILWHDINGTDIHMPAPVRQALVGVNGMMNFRPADHDGDDDDRR